MINSDVTNISNHSWPSCFWHENLNAHGARHFSLIVRESHGMPNTNMSHHEINVFTRYRPISGSSTFCDHSYKMTESLCVIQTIFLVIYKCPRWKIHGTFNLANFLEKFIDEIILYHSFKTLSNNPLMLCWHEKAIYMCDWKVTKNTRGSSSILYSTLIYIMYIAKGL